MSHRADLSRRRTWIVGLALSLALMLGLGAILLTTAAGAETTASWKLAGHDPANSRTQPLEKQITATNVATLAPKWTLTTHGDVSATPTVYAGTVFFPDNGGYLNAVNASTGAVLWQDTMASLDGGTHSRVSPAVYGGEVVVGNNVQGAGAHILAVNRHTGALLWNTLVESHPAAIITGNPVVSGERVIVGVSSSEEGQAEQAGYACCTFRGSVVALNAKTGALLWKAYTVPPNNGPCTASNPPSGCGYSGGAVWDTPAIGGGSVYVGSGNDYTVPDEAASCEREAMEHRTSDAGCTAPNDYFDSVIALSLKTGAIRWGRKMEGWDAYNLACTTKPPGAWCPSGESPDFDFGGAGPNLLKLGTRTVVGIGQKSGVYWALGAPHGELVWSKLVGPGTAEGGIQWGTAYDGTRIYVPIADPSRFSVPYTLANGESDTGGSWAALDPGTGGFDWQVATPGDAAALGPASEADGVVYVGDMASAGPNMFALSAATGTRLWSFAAEGSVNSAPAIVDGVLYWGSGYHTAGSHTFYAFSLGGR
ncbi:MAG TPA: PQQ-binding-like beta-propeller repeat protein [Solirubrobacteraceae bacterium]|jgi:polyvinyl alcohol dehydrogenase (cytochrome)